MSTVKTLGSARELRAALPALLERTEAGHRAVRLLGVSVSALAPREPAGAAQLVLFQDV